MRRYLMKNPLVCILIPSLLLCTAASAQLNRAKPRPAPVTAPVTTAAPAAPAPAAVETKPAEKPQATAEFKLLGFIGAAYAEQTYVLTCGGPKVGFSYGWFSFAVGFFPSLIYSNIYRDNSNPSTPIRPNLGVGPEIGFGKVAIIAPIYYMPGDRYYYTIGIGYKF